MRVTFDSNSWQPVIFPDKFAKDSRYADFLKIERAVRDGRIRGFISETVATLEAIKKVDRVSYFGGSVPKIDFHEEMVGNQIRIRVTMGPDNSRHPGLPGVLSDRLRAALALGIRLLRAPRLALARPAELRGSNLFAEETVEAEIAARNERSGEAVRAIEARGIGLAAARAISERIKIRLGLSVPSNWAWSQYLARAADPGEELEIAKSIAEWADGDAVASHLAYRNDFFCTEDKGKSVGFPSVLDATNRAWLEATYGIKFVTVSGLAAMISSESLSLSSLVKQP